MTWRYEEWTSGLLRLGSATHTMIGHCVRSPSPETSGDLHSKPLPRLCCSSYLWLHRYPPSVSQINKRCWETASQIRAHQLKVTVVKLKWTEWAGDWELKLTCRHGYVHANHHCQKSPEQWDSPRNMAGVVWYQLPNSEKHLGNSLGVSETSLLVQVLAIHFVSLTKTDSVDWRTLSDDRSHCHLV